ncbi:DNA topoisomerase III [Salmonella enterica subsp. enterica]|nr:DNA topoisomerase III [Salmonella enterica subsp. enterica]
MQLYLCEKPSQARDIARVLDARNRSDGYLHNATVTITWCFGHLLSMAAPEDYEPTLKHWRAEHLPFIPPAWRLVIRPEVRKQFRIIEKLLKQTDAVVIATDADREGETIAREILEQCRWRGPVQRLWLSSLDDASIHKALTALRPGDSTYPLYQAGLARARADWLVGINMTRACTLMNRRHKGVLSVGRVQTPTLRLVVERDREIARFTPRPWWRVDARLHAEGTSFLTQWQPDSAYCDDEGRCIRESAAREATARLQQAETALVMDVTTRREKTPPPQAFTLSALQQVCSKQWGMGAQEVLDIAQRLYETHKATTYPRTDCGWLPLSMHAEAPQVLAALVASDASLQPLATQLNLQQRSRLWDDSKITAHHGIIPTRKTVDLTQLNDSERKVYGLVRSHFLAQFLPDHEVDKTVLRLNCAGETLAARGSLVIVSGWRQLFLREMATHSPEETQALPALRQGQTCQVEQVDVRARQTQPPEHYTEGTLIAAMKNAARFVSDERLKQRLKENAGIGTEATRAGIIQTLLKRGYLIKQRRFLLATDTASALIDALPEKLKDPGTTALWEQMLDDIATGKMGLEAFLVQQQETVTALTAQIVRGQKSGSSG